MEDAAHRRVFQLASQLQDGHRPPLPFPVGPVTICQVPCVVDPSAALDGLRLSALAHLVPPDNALLNHPERPWFTPVTPIRADPNDLAAVMVTAQTWVGHQRRPRASVRGDDPTPLRPTTGPRRSGLRTVGLRRSSTGPSSRALRPTERSNRLRARRSDYRSTLRRRSE